MIASLTSASAVAGRTSKRDDSRKRRPLALLLFLVFTACSANRDGRSDQRLRDGDEFARAPLARERRGEAKQGEGVVVRRRVKSTGPDYALSRVIGAVALPSGGIAVLQARAERLLLFDSAGRYERGIGRRGAGPGEFDLPTKIGRRGDSLWVFDRALSRITVFRTSGELVRTIALPANGVGVLHDNGRVTIHSDREFGAAAVGRDSLRLQELLPSGRVSAARNPIEYVHRTLAYSVGGRSVVGLQPFDDGPLVAEAAGGSGFWFVRQEESMGAAQLHIERVDPAWNVIVSREVPFDPLPMSDAIAREAMNGILAERGASEDPAERRALEHAFYRPPIVPSATLLVPGVDGTLAIRRETIYADSTRWTLFDNDALPAADFNLARTDLLLTRDGNRIWFRSTTPDDEEEIVIARLERPDVR